MRKLASGIGCVGHFVSSSKAGVFGRRGTYLMHELGVDVHIVEIVYETFHGYTEEREIAGDYQE